MPDGGNLRPMDGGSEIRWLREVAGLSVKEAARALHIDVFQLMTWEQPDRRVPVGTLEAIRQVFAAHAKPEKAPARDEYVAGQTEVGLE